MITAPTLVIATLVLGIGTFAYRMVGPLLRTKVTLSPRMENLMAVSAVVLLAALVATSALIDGHDFAGFARPAGVAVGGLLAWRKAPFVLIVVAAAATAAGLRLLGVPVSEWLRSTHPAGEDRRSDRGPGAGSIAMAEAATTR